MGEVEKIRSLLQRFWALEEAPFFRYGYPVCFISKHLTYSLVFRYSIKMKFALYIW